jgi:hypothetical protein
MKIHNLAKITLLASSLVFLGTQSASAIVFGEDDFDSNRNFSNFNVNPDNSANNGTFSSTSDVFGIIDRTVNDSFADDTVANPPDAFGGLLNSTKTDNVFGVQDLTNPDNLSGTGTATWQFDISGGTNLSILIDFAAGGDFESSGDSFVFAASIDGGAPVNIFTSSVDEADSLTYTFEDGVTTQTVDDPLAINGTTLNNNFQTLVASLVGTGNTLTLEFNATNDGAVELFAFDNIVVEGDAAAAVPFEFSPSLGIILSVGLFSSYHLSRKLKQKPEIEL